MKIKRTYRFEKNTERGKKALKYLEKNVKGFSLKNDPNAEGYVIYEHYFQDKLNNSMKYLDELSLLSGSEAFYTTEEENEIKWFHLFCLWDYNKFVSSLDNNELFYDITNFCEKCWNGSFQNNLLAIKAEPNWKKRNILTTYSFPNEFFISNIFMNILENSALKGINFKDVRLGKYKIAQNIQQLFITNEFENIIDYEKTYFETVRECPECRRITYDSIGSPLYFKKEKIDTIDLDIFKIGDLQTNNYVGGYKYIAVSKKFKNLVEENNLSEGLFFIPIQISKEEKQ